MNINDLIEQGNQHRAEHHPELSLRCYAQVFGEDFNHGAAFNNYGNVLREMGYPERAIPFLHAAHDIDPANVTAEFNLAVAYLLKGDYERGWSFYEARWKYEHLAGVKPQLPRPEWQGENPKDKTILVVGEQGLGDQIQFLRMVANLAAAEAKVKLMLSPGVKALFPVPAGNVVGI